MTQPPNDGTMLVTVMQVSQSRGLFLTVRHRWILTSIPHQTAREKVGYVLRDLLSDRYKSSSKSKNAKRREQRRLKSKRSDKASSPLPDTKKIKKGGMKCVSDDTDRSSRGNESCPSSSSSSSYISEDEGNDGSEKDDLPSPFSNESFFRAINSIDAKNKIHVLGENTTTTTSCYWEQLQPTPMMMTGFLTCGQQSVHAQSMNSLLTIMKEDDGDDGCSFSIFDDHDERNHIVDLPEDLSTIFDDVV